jgi:ribosomal protein L11 methylase PrmA
MARTPVYSADIDPVAVAVARQNARINNAGPLVRPVIAVFLLLRLFICLNSAGGPA